MQRNIHAGMNESFGRDPNVSTATRSVVIEWCWRGPELQRWMQQPFCKRDLTSGHPDISTPFNIQPFAMGAELVDTQNHTWVVHYQCRENPHGIIEKAVNSHRIFYGTAPYRIAAHGFFVARESVPKTYFRSVILYKRFDACNGWN